MNFKKNLFLALIVILSLSSWGIWGHQRIAKAAILALPASDLQVFMHNHLDFVVEESVVPDLRKYTINDKAEFPRHFIDIEDFGKSIDSLPLTSKEAYKEFDAKMLQSKGMLPWYIQDVMEKLTKAMKEKRKTEILFLAADLSHYIADAHMPLHTSSNHNGQLSNQKGIHSLWESQLPEMLSKNFKFYVGQAHYIDNVTNETWAMIKRSHALVNPLLQSDALVRKAIPDSLMFVKDEQGKIKKNKFNQNIFTADYVNKLNTNLDGMVQKQLQGAVIETANFWLTAWINAGKPNLSDLDDKHVTCKDKKSLKKDLRKYKNGDLLFMLTEGEY